MDRVRWETPNKVQRYNNPLMNSPRLHMTPAKQSEICSKHTAYQNNAGRFTVLPSHITPPSGMTKLIGRNPFEADLTSRLHQSMISPNIFAKISSTSQQSPEFAWTIEELACIQPVKIEESSVQQICSPDPEKELKAQEAIDQFFKGNQIVPSPWEIKEKQNISFTNMNTPNRHLDDLNSIKELSKSKKDAWSQTVLSLPMDLPQSIIETLRSFFTFTQEQNADNDVNSSNSSLRRKLFFNHDECTDDNESFVSSSSCEMNDSMVLSCSPPQSGMFIHGTPIKGSLKPRRQSNESESLSSPYISPIHNNEDNVFYKKIESQSHNVTQLDFTINMSIDVEVVNKSQNSNDSNLLDISSDTHDVKCKEENQKLIIINDNKTNAYDSASMVLPKCKNSMDNIIHSDSTFNNNKSHNVTSLKIVTEVENSSTHENHEQCNTMFNPQNISNSVQDTGYETYSMNSTAIHTVNSYNTSDNHKVHLSEQILTFNDAQLSWKENMINIFSSTPSKGNEEKES